MQSSDFGELRSLVNQPQSRKVWEQICAWVDQRDGHDIEEQILPYIDGQHWSDAYRSISKPNALELLGGAEGKPHFAIARTFSLRNTSSALWRDYEDESGMEEAYSECLKRDSLEHIATIDLSYNRLELGAIEALAANERPRLESLVLSTMRVAAEPTEWFNLLISAPWFSQLRSLDLSDSGIDSECIALLAGADLPELEHLDIGKNDLDFNDIKKLAKASFAKNLRSLGVGALIKSAVELHALNFPSLLAIDMTGAHIDKVASKAVADLPFADKLVSLTLWNAQIGLNGVKALSAFSTLERLDIGKSKVDVQGIEALSECSFASNLVELYVYSPFKKGLGGNERDAIMKLITALDPARIERFDLTGIVGARALLEESDIPDSLRQIIHTSAN